jgi:hypothetical protein
MLVIKYSLLTPVSQHKARLIIVLIQQNDFAQSTNVKKKKRNFLGQISPNCHVRYQIPTKIEVSCKDPSHI